MGKKAQPNLLEAVDQAYFIHAMVLQAALVMLDTPLTSLDSVDRWVSSAVLIKEPIVMVPVDLDSVAV